MSYTAEELDDELNLYAIDGNVRKFAVDKLQNENGVSLGLQFDAKTDELESFTYTHNTHPTQTALIGERTGNDRFMVTRIYGKRHPAIRLLPAREQSDWEFLKSETTAALELPARPEEDYESFLNAFEAPLTYLLNNYDMDPDAAEKGRTVTATTKILQGDLEVEALTEHELTAFAETQIDYPATPTEQRQDQTEAESTSD